MSIKDFFTKIKSLIGLLVAVLLPLAVSAQQEIEMADMMRAEGKIYVVVAVVTIILIGLLLYVWRLDKKISLLEQTVSQKNSGRDN